MYDSCSYVNTCYCGDDLTKHIAQELPLHSHANQAHIWSRGESDRAKLQSQAPVEQLSQSAQRKKSFTRDKLVCSLRNLAAGVSLHAPGQHGTNSKSRGRQCNTAKCFSPTTLQWILYRAFPSAGSEDDSRFCVKWKRLISRQACPFWAQARL